MLKRSNEVQELEADLHIKTDALKPLVKESQEYSKQDELRRQTSISLTTTKSSVEALELRKQTCVQRLQLFRNRLDEKMDLLARYGLEQRSKKEIRFAK